MIDWDRVALLRDEVGEEGFNQIVDLFLEEVSGAIARLPSVPAPRLEAELHFLKGGALNLGFVELAQHCERGEQQAALGRAADLTQLAALYEASRNQFLAVLHSPQGLAGLASWEGVAKRAAL